MSDWRITLHIWLRDLSLWVYGYEHIGGGSDGGNMMTIYARKRKPKK